MKSGATCLVWALTLCACADDGEATQEAPDEIEEARDASARPDGARKDAGRDASRPDTPRRDAGVRADAAQRDADEPEDEGGSANEPRSAGCGMSAEGSDQFETRTIQVDGKSRKYAILVPPGYDPARAYPLIFRFHGTGGDGLSGGLEIERQTDDGAIIVAPDGQDSQYGRGWLDVSSHEAADLSMFDALLAEVAGSYCVDQQRVYAYGFSAGASFSELLACKRGNKLRAIGAIAGWDRTHGAECQGPVAAWLAHGVNDEVIRLASGPYNGASGRDQLRTQNGCGEETEPYGDDSSLHCVRYTDCMAGYPVVWCEVPDRGHDPMGEQAAGQAWKFFSEL